MIAPFADRLMRRVRKLGPLCVGLDPDIAEFSPLFQNGDMRPGEVPTAAAVGAFCLAVLKCLEGRVAAVKIQSACFERHGAPGVTAMHSVLEEARQRNLLVILDVKRGDVGPSAAAYASAYLDSDAPLRADAITVNPWCGLDTLEPFIAAAERSGAGIFALLKTSNPGADALQDRPVEGRPLYEHLARALAPLAERLHGAESGWSGLGAVVAATQPQAARRLRELLPRSLFLTPGYGAQGASAADALAGFARGPGGPPGSGLEGGLVNSSRQILYTPETRITGNLRNWQKAIVAGARSAAGELARAGKQRAAAG
ncbi:MAG: orotidine-5'-phosphate decarboxylase [Deltaproteobacteria bacterium]|nr:orotidine-5'-phosphate decarboxylase [Deltaproteobacteria bacterium]